jgi:stage III sporulation protein AE
MKKMRVLALCAALCLALAVPAFAVDAPAGQEEARLPVPEAPKQAAFPETALQEQAKALDLDGVQDSLPEAAEEYMGSLRLTDSVGEADGILKKLRDGALDMLGDFLKAAAGSAAAMLTVAILCSLAGSLDIGGRVPAYVQLAGVVAIAAVAAADIHSFLGQGVETLQTLSDFSKALLPCLAAAATAAGALTSAAAKFAVTALYMDMLLNLASQVVMPVIYGYTALVIANAAVGGNALAAAAGCMKWLCKGFMIVITLAFTAYLTVSGVIAGSADAVATRLVKTTLSSALPVVGSILSDVAGTLAAGVSALRGAIGVFGMLAVLSVCLAPFLRLGAQYLIYKAAAAVATSISGSRMGDLIDGLGTAFGMALSLAGSCALFLFVSMFSLIQTVI